MLHYTFCSVSLHKPDNRIAPSWGHACKGSQPVHSAPPYMLLGSCIPWETGTAGTARECTMYRTVLPDLDVATEPGTCEEVLAFPPNAQPPQL
jgi:hypothetical protein